MNKILLDARSSVSSFQDISVLTLDGVVVASTDAARIGSIQSSDEVFIRGREENSADTLFLDENHNLSVYLSGPNCGDVFTPQQILGHSTLEMARHYVNPGANHVAIQHRKFSPLDGLNLRKYCHSAEDAEYWGSKL